MPFLHAGTNLTTSDVDTPNLSTLIIETLEVFNKPVFSSGDEGEKAAALQGLYTLWYFAGVSLGILPPLPGQEKVSELPAQSNRMTACMCQHDMQLHR